jgi:serine/threonine protein kinase
MPGAAKRQAGGSGGSRSSSSKRKPPQHPTFVGKSRSVYNFERLNVIGQGTYGVVYRARDKETQAIVALKKLRMEREKEGMPLTSLREIRLLKACHHPNVVELQDIVVGNKLDSIFLVFEYCENDLATLLDTGMKRKFTEGEVKCLLRQLLSATAYMHDRWMIHRDIKMSNLLYNNRGCLKVADFGLARLFGYPKRAYTPRVVTLWYRAPELLVADPKLHKLLSTHAEQDASNAAVFKALDQHQCRSASTGGGAAGVRRKADAGPSLAATAPEKVPVASGGHGADLNEAADSSVKTPKAPVYSTGIDTWSIGCIFAELLRGEPLCPATSEVQLLGMLFQLLGAPSTEGWPDLPGLWPSYDSGTAAALVRGDSIVGNSSKASSSTGSSQRQRLEEQFRQLTPAGLSLLRDFLCYDPVKRISCSQALIHKYFNEAPRPQTEAMMPTFPSAHEQQQAAMQRQKQEEMDARRRTSGMTWQPPAVSGGGAGGKVGDAGVATRAGAASSIFKGDLKADSFNKAHKRKRASASAAPSANAHGNASDGADMLTDRVFQ